MSLSSLYDGVGFGGDAKEKENMGLDASQIGEYNISFNMEFQGQT